MTAPHPVPLPLDGNCLAGPLSEVFTFDPTGATRRCPVCGLVSALAELRVYGPGPGFTARCPGCGSVALRLADHGSAIWLQIGDSGAMRFPVPPRDR